MSTEKPKTPQEILDGIEDTLEQEGLLKEEPQDLREPPDPPRRVVVLGHEHDAVFEGAPVNKLLVFKADANGHLELPYFDPACMTDEQVRDKVRLYITFS